MSNTATIYLDHGILSDARKGGLYSERVWRMLNRLRDGGGSFVYSSTTVEECRQTGERKEEFVEVLEALSANYVEPTFDYSHPWPIASGNPRTHIMEQSAATNTALRLIEDLLQIPHYCSDWMGDVDARKVKDDMRLHLSQGIEEILQGATSEEAHLIKANLKEVIADFHQLDFDKQQLETQNALAALRKKLPKNYAQLDDIPAEDVAQAVIAAMEPEAQSVISKFYPRGFWISQRDPYHLTGFAMMLFQCGVTRDTRVKKGPLERRSQHFKGQFRDCLHFGEAAKVDYFLTKDGDAARLAKATYAYAGVDTKVIRIEIDRSK